MLLKKTPGLGEKVKLAMSRLTAATFGYEKKAKSAICSYLNMLSKQRGIPKDRLVVRIQKDFGQIKAMVYHNGKCIQEISMEQLITVFTGLDPDGLPHLKEKVENGIDSLIKDVAKANGLDKNGVQLCIVNSCKEVWVTAQQGTSDRIPIAFGELIAYFGVTAK